MDERAYAGSTPPAIRSVLRRFDVAQTIRFFADLGVELKREDTGKLFPTTDSARTVLDALLRGARAAGTELRPGCRVEGVERIEDGRFRVYADRGEIVTSRVILATGGRSLPRSGSDGTGIEIARRLGHSVTPHLVPALVGLTLADGSYVRDLSGLAAEARLEVRSGSGRLLHAITGPSLCTHFGLSGPAPMDISRHWQLAVLEDPQTTLVVSWLPGETAESLDAGLQRLESNSPQRYLAQRLPGRLARALCLLADIDPDTTGHTLTRNARRALVRVVTSTPVPVTGTRGWNNAEATAGGIPLKEVRLATMESRVVPGLYLCGELLDVDGRIGGYNFQWAWSSGFVAGTAAASTS